MRVALVSNSARLGDAIGNQVAEKLAFFLERGADVRVLVESAERLHPSVSRYAQEMSPVPEGTSWDFLRSADLVCVEFGHYYSLLGLLPLLAGGGSRIVIDYHGITPPDLWGPYHRAALEKGRAYRGLAWSAGVTLVHSRCIERELLEVTGIPPARLARIGLPIDPEQFFPAGADISDFRKALGVEHATLLLFVGRLAANKRAPLLVEVLARLRDVRPDVHLLVVGDTSDIYQVEADRCRKLARDLGVADRLHFLGHLVGEPLRKVYQAADVLVQPSAWESFSVPVIEAMACGLPVVAARAFALPETIGPAGLTFRVDDGAGCARQIRRVLACRRQGVESGARSAERPHALRAVRSALHPQRPASEPACSPGRVAVVSFRYGNDFAGGAEWSLRRIAITLRQAGHAVEVFTTCTRSETDWRNELPAGSSRDGDIPVHRFPVDPPDRERHLESHRTIVHANGRVPPQVEQDYVANSVHSSSLLAMLQQREPEFDAILVGPYLFGLTWDIARHFPGKTLLLPCFHDEPLARLAVWLEVYEKVAGILYHSAAERDFAQTELGLNHPGTHVIGTWIDVDGHVENSPGGGRQRYVAYCGRYSEQKQVPELVDFARRYSEINPGRFKFVFMGQGEVEIPDRAWAADLGFVDEVKKRAAIAGAEALIQLSRKESLSLVALEAWSLGTPVIASAGCPVLAEHLQLSGGGAAIGDFPAFAAALDDLWTNPQSWEDRGRRGQRYVRESYGSAEDFGDRLENALADMTRPLAARMRQAGLERAAHFYRETWRQRFGRLVDELLHRAPPSCRTAIELVPHAHEQRVPAGTTTTLVAVRVCNRGSTILVPDGPARTFLCSRVFDRDSGRTVGPEMQTVLPDVLAPGAGQAAVVPVHVPAVPGKYGVELWAASAASPLSELRGTCQHDGACRVELDVDDGSANTASWSAPFLDSARAALAKAHAFQQLPDGYVDVTCGWLARCKRWLKRKLLNNFKIAYVDVLSRQQTQVNHELVAALQETLEWCAALDHGLRGLQERLARLESARTDESGTSLPPHTSEAVRKGARV